MADKASAMSRPGTNSGSIPAISRPPGHRAVDARDAIAELTERAQEISLEAGSKVAIAMKDVISAAAGLAGFAVESARDLVQFMVRRGQMTQDEGDKLLREAEAAHSKRPMAERKRPTASEVATKARAAQRAAAAAAREQEMALAMKAHQAHIAKAKKAISKPKVAASKPKAAKKGGKKR